MNSLHPLSALQYAKFARCKGSINQLEALFEKALYLAGSQKLNLIATNSILLRLIIRPERCYAF